MKLSEVQIIVEDQFLDIVIEFLKPSHEKIRLVLKDKSFVDIRLSRNIENRFDFHWERIHIDNTIYRYDNLPDMKFKKLKTFPFHFHKKTELRVIASPFSKTLPKAFIDFLEFVRLELKKAE